MSGAEIPHCSFYKLGYTKSVEIIQESYFVLESALCRS